MARSSWLVKAAIILESAVVESLWRASYRKPLQYGHPGRIFCDLRTAVCELRSFHESVAAERRIRRGRPERSDSSTIPRTDGMAGGPLRAEGFPKRRCQFESVAAERRI